MSRVQNLNMSWVYGSNPRFLPKKGEFNFRIMYCETKSQKKIHLPAFEPLGNTFLEGLPPLLPKEITQQLFCFLGGYNLTQVTPLINRRIGDKRIIRSELSNDPDDFSEVERNSESK